MDSQRGLVDCIAQAAAEVFSQATSSTWSVAVTTADGAPSADEAHLPVGLTISGSLQGSASLEFRNADALRLAQKFLAEPVDETAKLDEGRKEAVEELIRQVAGVAATKIKSLFGEVQLQVKIGDALSAPMSSFVLLVAGDSPAPMPVALRLSSELVRSLSAKQNLPAETADKEQKSEDEEDQGSPDRVMGVRLKLSLRFGQCLLTLRELVSLHSGEILELDRHVEDPVELVIGSKVIALGHVVVVDGNYGIRVTERRN